MNWIRLPALLFAFSVLHSTIGVDQSPASYGQPLLAVAEQMPHLDGTGPAARYFAPYGINSDGTNLFVNDASSDTLHKVEIATGAVTTLA
jgi:hypothetical protein